MPGPPSHTTTVGVGDTLEEYAPRGFRFSGAPLVCNDFPLANCHEDAPPGSEVEPIDLDDLVCPNMQDWGANDSGNSSMS